MMKSQTSKPITRSRSNEDPAPNAGKGEVSEVMNLEYFALVTAA